LTDLSEIMSSDMEKNFKEGTVTEDKALRYRVNVTISTKGVRTWECTVDGTNYTQEEILEKSDNLVAQLEQRYPAPEVDK